MKHPWIGIKSGYQKKPMVTDYLSVMACFLQLTGIGVSTYFRPAEAVALT